MAGFMTTVRKFATSPQGKKVFKEAQRAAKDPETRRKIAEARERLQGGGGKRPPA